MASDQPRPWYTDGLAWAIFAAGVAAMFGVLFVALTFAGYGSTVAELTERARLRAVALFAAASFAISGPLAVTIGQWVARRAGGPSRKKSKDPSLEEL